MAKAADAMALLGKTLEEYMDIDKIDIGRAEEVRDDEGFIITTDPTVPIWVDVPCHITFASTDNPLPNADIFPIVISLTIHVPVWVDLRRGDFVYAKKCDAEGKVLEVYTGVVNQPQVMASRKIFQQTMRRV